MNCEKRLAADAQVFETLSRLSFVSVEALHRGAAGKVFNGKSFAKKLVRFMYKFIDKI